MSMQSLSTHPVKTAVYGFLGLMGVAVAMAAARGMGLVEVDVERRGLGLVIGAVFVFVGNFLPKLRPLNTPDGNPAKATAAERSAGWILVLAGIAYIAMFVFAPLDQARPVASIIGIGAVAVIAANWAWLARGMLFGARQTVGGTAPLSEQAAGKRRVMIWLLFAFFYLFAGACVVFLFGDEPPRREIGLWMVLGFSTMYAVLYAVLDDKRSCK